MCAKWVVFVMSFGVIPLLAMPTSADLKESAVAVWLFDEGQGDTAKDSVDGHDGQLVGGVDWINEGMFGNALEFSGERGSRVEVPHQDDLTLETWTITAWVRLQPPIESSDGWAIVVVKDPANGFQNYGLDMNARGNVVSEVTSGGSWSNSVSVTEIYDDEWHFLAASYDGDALRTFVDGEFESEQVFGPGDVSDAPLSIGDRLDSSQPVFGLIDDVGLFNMALEDDDLLVVMNDGLKTALALGVTVLRAGDADQDLDFDQLDLVRVQVAGKYLTGRAATWGEGDFNGAPGGLVGNPPPGDGKFDQLDIIAALSAGLYLTGPYSAVKQAPANAQEDGQTSLVYFPSTGELRVDPPSGTDLTSINVDSAAGIFTGDAAQNLGGSFDNDSDNNIFKATFGSSFGAISFGNVAQTGLSEDFLLNDLSVVGSLAGGGDLGDVDLIYVPEPPAALLVLLALLCAVPYSLRRRSMNLSE